MKRDFRSCMLLALFGLPIFLLLFIAGIYFANCGFSADCSAVSRPIVIHTPIPSLIPVTFPIQTQASPTEARVPCQGTARTLLSSWVNAGYKETQPFQFTDIYGNICQATFTDVMPLFDTPDLWSKGALACDACHNADVSISAAHLDLSSYAGIVAGGKRSSTSAKGEDILGGGMWELSILNDMLFISQQMPFGHPSGSVSPGGPTIQAGTLVSGPIPAPTEETTGQEEIARPSNPGGPGDAINLTGDKAKGQQVFIDHCQICHGEEGKDNIVNPGSADGTVPPLNPIDETLVSPDYKTFAYNVDLFIQNGSTPEGLNPVFLMPAWGAKKALTQQQIADVIAYTISLNQGK